MPKVTIEIEQESLEYLKAFMERINTQNNRITATPFGYQIQEMVERLNDDGDIIYWFNREEGETFTTEEALEYVFAEVFDEKLVELKRELRRRCEDFFLQDNGFDRMIYKEEPVLRDFFFTEEACEDHIAANHYHYNKPKSFVIHLGRNPEFYQIMEILGEASGKGWKKH